MHWLLYLRLVFLTAGTLLPFFWMVVILGHRRQRNFERIFFFLCLALTCFFGSSLLALNAQLYYSTPPQGLLRFAWTFLCLGLWFIPPLVLHVHVEYAAIRGLLRSSREKRAWLAISLLPVVALGMYLWRALCLKGSVDFDRPTHLLGLVFQIWLVLAIAAAAIWQLRFRKAAPDGEQKSFHRTMAAVLFSLSALLIGNAVIQRVRGPEAGESLTYMLMLLALLPLGIMISNVQRFNFLQIGRQRNLIYAVFAVFLALLYLSFVRRAGQWLEPYLPPEGTAALLLFLPVVFFEPLQRLVGRTLQATAHKEMDVVQRLTAEIQEEARRGNLKQLVEFIQRRTSEVFGLANATLTLLDPSKARVRTSVLPAGERPQVMSPAQVNQYIWLRQPSGRVGMMRAEPHGAALSGETRAALEFLCEQLPAALDLCRLIEEKLQLERELAERERLALVGQMAASISHNLKNPLGSMKTILQVQMESAEMPASMRHETQMVLDEINRLSGKLNQLLQFSRPGARSGTSPGRCGLALIAENVVNVLRHEAESRGISIELDRGKEPCEVAASGEVASDILSNLVLNAMEAAPEGGHVRLSLLTQNGNCIACIEDDGPGISPALKDKILQPFFTTKARGTGLGLAIVTRRLEEIGGRLTIESPIHEQRGSRFRVTLPLAGEERPS